MGNLSNTTINGVSYEFKDAGAARQSHSHTKSQITDFPTSMPASDVPAWAKASTKPTYTASETGAVPNTILSGSPDLDTYLTTGVYHITTSTATHAPTTNHATLFVDATVGTPYQIFKPDNVDTTWYTRHRSGSSWTSWVAMKFTDTTYSAATTSAAGLMSATDKSKLDGIASGATKTTVDSALSSTSTNPVQNKVINSALAGKASTAVATTSAAGLMSATDKTKLDEIADSGTLGSLFIDSTNYMIANGPSYQGKHVFGCVSMRPMSGGYYIGTIQSGWTPSEDMIEGIAVIENLGAFSVTTYYWTSRSGLNINTSPPGGSNVLLLFDYLAA